MPQRPAGNRLLVVGFGLNLLLMIFVGVYIFGELVDFRDNSAMLYRHPFVVSNAVKDINIEILLMHRQLQSMVWAETPAEVNKDVAELRQREDIVLQRFELVADRYLGNKDDVHAALQAFLDWRDDYNEAVRLLGKGKNREAAAVIARQGAEHVKLLEHKSQQLVDFADGEATELYGRTIFGQRRVTLVVSVLLGLAVVVALVTSLLVLRLENRRVRQIQEHLHLIDQNIHIATLLPDGTVADITHALCRYLGLVRDQVLDRPFASLFNSGSGFDIPDEAWRVADSGMVWEGEVELPELAFGGNWASVAIHPVMNHTLEATAFKVVFTDITYQKEVERLAQVDPLTAVYNRRYFEHLIEQQIRLARRNHERLEFILVDIDYFKEYNDNCGHQAGDLALQKVTATLKELFRRPDDYIFRLGGDEFGVLPSLGSATGQVEGFGEVIRRRIEALHIEHPASDAGPYMTVSVGSACYPFETLPDRDELFREADDALYEAKERRNAAVSHTCPKS